MHTLGQITSIIERLSSLGAKNVLPLYSFVDQKCPLYIQRLLRVSLSESPLIIYNI